MALQQVDGLWQVRQDDVGVPGSCQVKCPCEEAGKESTLEPRHELSSLAWLLMWTRSCEVMQKLRWTKACGRDLDGKKHVIGLCHHLTASVVF